MDYNYGNGNNNRYNEYNDGNYGSNNGYNGYNGGNYGNGKQPGKFMMKLAQMMQGRYGADNLYRFLVFLALILIIVGRIVNFEYMNLIVIAIFIYATFRMYSKNIYKRQQENLKYLKITAPIRNKFYAAKYKKQQKQAKANDTAHIYIKCAGCGKEYRVPKNVGTIDATCPNCKARTRVRTNEN